MEYKPMVTLKKGIVQLACFGLPLFITTYLQWYPEVDTLTVGTVFTIFINWLKNKK
jgi:hypothetical protein